MPGGLFYAASSSACFLGGSSVERWMLEVAPLGHQVAISLLGQCC